MRLILGLIALLLLSAGIIGIIIVSIQDAGPDIPEEVPGFTLLEAGRAGDAGYAVAAYRGKASITMLTYSRAPLSEITIINESQALSEESLAYFTDSLAQAKDYGFSLKVSDRRVLGKGIFVVPAGGIPSYVLDDIMHNATSAQVLLVGKSDLVLDNGLRKEDWYSSLSEEQKKRVALYNMSVFEFIQSNSSLLADIMENSWALDSREQFNLSGSGKATTHIAMGKSRYMRILYSYAGGSGYSDSQALKPTTPITLKPQSVFEWQTSIAGFDLGKTNGTAFLEVWKDGSQLESIKLKRVTDSNYFEEPLMPGTEGNYIVRVVDNSGTIAGGVLHVKGLSIKYLGSSGFSYYFNVTVDNAPVRNEKATVHLSNSSNSKDIFINDGLLTVPAKLEKGTNTFNFHIYGTTVEVDVEHGGEGFADIYIKYGIPGFLLVVAVFFIARMSRRPVYTLRFGEVAGEIRKDVKISPKSAIGAFSSIRKEMGIGRNPITAQEFSLALKRHVTDGADVTEGNVEELLRQLMKKGLIESYNQYYQLKGEGNIQRNSLIRRIRDKLIESGVRFKTKGSHFITDNLEIGFFGDKFDKMALIVVEDGDELGTLLAGLGPAELSRLKIKQANGLLSIVTIDRLNDVI